MTSTTHPVLHPALTPQGAVGLALSLAVAASTVGIALVEPLASPTLIAIVLGVLAGNVFDLQALRPGTDIAAKHLLRLGIVLLGLQVSLQQIGSLGAGTLTLVLVVVATGVPVGWWLGRRLGLTSSQSLLTASGFSICGAAAVAAADGVIDADDTETTTSVALVVLFGTAMIPIVVLGSSLGLGSSVAGVWAGASIHEVAQVVAAGGILGGGALAAAVVVKLARVVLLAPVMAVLALRRRAALRKDGGPAGEAILPPLVPLFVVGFAAAVALRSVVQLPQEVLDAAKLSETLLLAAAMFALGTGVRWSLVRKVGLRPVVHAALCTVYVGVVGLVGALVLA